MTIARKLGLGFGILILLFVVAGLIVGMRLGTISANLNEVTNTEEPSLSAAYEMEVNLVETNQAVLTYLQTGQPQSRRQAADAMADFERAQDSYEELADTGRGRELLSQIGPLYTDYKEQANALLQGEPGADVGDEELNRFISLQLSINKRLDNDLQQWSRQQLTGAEDDTAQAVRGIRNTLISLLLASLLVGGAAVLLINRNIVRSVEKLEDGARRFGRGEDHRIELQTQDELGTVAVAFNDMLDSRREAHRALEESEERFQGLSDAAFEGVVFSEEGRILEANQAFVRLFGYEAEEVAGMDSKAFTLPEYHDRIQQNTDADSQAPFEVVGIRKDGSTFDVELRGRRTVYQGRKVYVTAVRDITQRKEAERALQESKLRLQTIIANAQIILFAVDRTGEITLSEGQGLEAIDLQPGQAVGQSVFEMYRGYPQVLETIRIALSGEAASAVLDLDGTILDAQFSPVAEDGGISGIIGVATDVTERHKADLEIRQSEERFQLLAEESIEGLILARTVRSSTRTPVI